MMQRWRLIFVSLLLVLAQVSFGQSLPPRPNPPVLVNDYTGILTADQRQALERKLVAFDDSSSNQVVVVIVPSTNGEDPGDYANRLGAEWGVGNKQFNNGVVLLVAKEDRKVFIAPGTGLESALPDITCKAIIETEIVPNFRSNDFYRGIDEGTDAIIKATRGEYQPPAGYADRGSKGGGSKFFFIIVIIIIIIILSSINRGGGGSFMSRRGSTLWWFPTGGWGGGSSGGGGWGGGGGGGGGFGGFGGGGFGGGGSGGSW